MRFPVARLTALVAAIAVVVSCDGGPATTRFGNGIAGGATGGGPVTPPAPGSSDSNPPFVRIDTPLASPVALVNIGDSILIITRIIDDRKVATLSITGYKFTGSANLGTLVTVQRYPTITVPVAGQTFRPGLTDTIIRRYLKPATPTDTSVDSLVIEAVLQDSAGNTVSTKRTVQIVTGPRVAIVAPTANDSVPRGLSMSISATADHPTGVDTMWIRVMGDATWPAPGLDTTIGKKFPPGTRAARLDTTLLVPLTAPLRGRMTISANAIDVNRNPGAASPIIVFVRATASIPPRVYQTVPAKMEYLDSITVTATADGVRDIGRVILDSVGAVLIRDSVEFVSPFTANKTQKLPVTWGLGLSAQGQRISVISFAHDTSGLIGYSLPSGSSIPVTTQAAAFKDTSAITYGRTYAFPRPGGNAGDIAIDPVRGSVFVSNTSFNLVEVWTNAAKNFSPTGVAVGAQPWGMFVANNPDTLLVGNSGATTISRVFIGTAIPASMIEDLSNTPGAGRIRTRNTVIFPLQFFRDDVTGKITLTAGIPTSYSDRPQYVVQSAGGRVFYSTKPTADNTAGTLRWLDPSLPGPDPRQIWQYGGSTGVSGTDYSIFNVDSIRVGKAASSTPISDTLYIYDHPYGQLAGSIVTSDSVPLSAIAKAVVLGSDAEAVLDLDVGSLALTDTTFVAASGDRNWVAFGEGNTGSVGRIMLVNDPIGFVPGFFSPAVTVADIVDNASERVFGLALDSTGLQVMSHGSQTYLASVDNPFHLRLDGVYDSFDNGAGVAFHPQANGTGSLNAFRVAFTATSTGVIEIFDVAHYNNRGRLITKGNLYGPLRASGPLPGDPAGVILKVYGLTAAGLIVIDLQAADIKPGP
jgi:hypothetical protein